MKERVIAKRYARALFELALEAKTLNQVAEEMRLLQALAAQVPSLLQGLSDERVERGRRIAAAARIGTTLGLSRESAHALELLVARGRIILLPLIAEEVLARTERYEKFTRARATVADHGSAAEVGKRIEKILSDALHTTAACDVDVDADLLGGFSLLVGDMRYDASIRGKLERMKETLS